MVQVHPTRRCNLRCLHCYSSSAPEERGQIGAALLRDAIEGAAAEGYRALSVSGGEPLLYEGLESLLGHAHDLGLLTTLTTNGTLLDERRLAGLLPLLDFVAISLDGVPESHDRVRAQPRAFSRMHSRLGGLRQQGLPFGFIFTLRKDNVEELPWAVRFAVQEGARLIQIHPLTEAGRAASELPGKEPGEREVTLAWLIAARLRQLLGDALVIHMDVLDRAEVFGASPADAGRPLSAPERGPRRLADLISPLVIEEDGQVVPLQHGFPRTFALGHLAEAPLAELAARFRSRLWPRFRELVERTARSLDAGEAPPFVDWYREVSRAAAAA